MFKGMKQGCPLSPLLFILAVDSFNVIIRESISSGFLDGISDHIREWLVFNLHFVDDTLLFSSLGFNQAVILKLMLSFFELSYGLKINFRNPSFFFLGENHSLASTLSLRLIVLWIVSRSSTWGSLFSDKGLKNDD